MSDYRDGIINSSVSPTKTYTTTTLANIDSSNGNIVVEIDASVSYRHTITLVRADATSNSIIVKGINGTKIVGGFPYIAVGMHSYITLAIISKDEMIIIGRSDG